MLDVFQEQKTDSEHAITSGLHFTEDSQTFLSKMKAPRRKPDSVMTEAVLAAKAIEERAVRSGRAVTLCLSGGIDSECMAEAFLAAQIPFKVAIMRFHDHLNHFDIKHAFDFCKRHNLNYDIYDIDILNFFESGEYFQYGRKYRCQSPQLASHLWLMDQVIEDGGFPVLGGEPVMPSYSTRPDEPRIQKVTGLPQELHHVYIRYREEKKMDLEPFFFQSTAELITSMWEVKTARKILFQDHAYRYPQKCQIYEEAGFKAQSRPSKYTGFEWVRFYYDYRDGKDHGMAFNERYRSCLEALSPFKKQEAEVLDLRLLKPSPKNAPFSRRQFLTSLGAALGVVTFFPKELLACGQVFCSFGCTDFSCSCVNNKCQ